MTIEDMGPAFGADLPITVAWERSTAAGPCGGCTVFSPTDDYLVAVVRVGERRLRVCISCIGRLFVQVKQERTMSDATCGSAITLDTQSPVH